MICPNCSTQNQADAKVCSKCQQPLIPAPNKKPRNWKLPGIFLTIIASAVIISALLLNENRKSTQIAHTAPVPQTVTIPGDEPQPNQPQSKYDIDTDYDAIPDFVEVELGFSPTENAVKACALKSCQAADLANTQEIKKNILLILDSSGSMAAQISGKSKMEIAKEAVRNYVDQLVGNENTALALMVYGHAGSNLEKDKAVSCQTIDLVYPFSSPNLVEFDQALTAFQPTGWTAIGGSLAKAAEIFQGKEQDENYVIVISDGIETCDTNPVTAAQTLKNSGISPQIDVIGFAVDARTKSQLEQVASIGGGQYFSADTADELNNTLQENIQKVEQAMICAGSAVIDYISCLNNYYIPANKYLNRLLSEEMVAQERTIIIRSANDMMKYFTNAVNNTDSLIDLVKKSGEDYRRLKEQQLKQLN